MYNCCRMLKGMLQGCVLLSLCLSSVFAAKSLQSAKAVSVVTVPTVYTQDQANIIVTADSPRFVIKLDSNPTTGYAWFLHEYDENIIQPVKHAYVAGDAKLVGSGGYELWTFKVKPNGLVVPHQTTIRFVYARPWDGSDSSSQVAFHISTGVAH